MKWIESGPLLGSCHVINGLLGFVEGMYRSGGTAAFIIDLSTRWGQVINLMPQLLYHWT